MTTEWYELFSRGARDWLRHNEKIREAVKRSLPKVVADGDLISRPDNRTVQVPVRLLEHYRFRLADKGEQHGVGQGDAAAGDVLRPAQRQRGGGRQGSGEGEGEPHLILELKVDDIVDWLWEELELPDLRPTPGGPVVEEELIREGWDRRGARARLDRRRTLKESIKRRAVQPDGVSIANDDLRFRNLVKRGRPTTAAVVAFVLDVSSSMRQPERRLAKSFFFWALQGLKRRYRQIDTLFVAHTVAAWEFGEDEFFQVTAEGGTLASRGLRLAREVFDERYGADRYNGYLFYASDGGNFSEDREQCWAELAALGQRMNFIGYVEVLPDLQADGHTETGAVFRNAESSGVPTASYVVASDDDIWDAIRAFFRSEAARAAEVSS